MIVLMSMSPPLGSNFYVTTPSKDAVYPQLGEVGHIVDSCIIIKSKVLQADKLTQTLTFLPPPPPEGPEYEARSPLV